MLYKYKITVALLNPRLARAFAVSEGIKAKTDPIDAKMLLSFAKEKSPRATEYIGKLCKVGHAIAIHIVVMLSLLVVTDRCEDGDDSATAIHCDGQRVIKTICGRHVAAPVPEAPILGCVGAKCSSCATVKPFAADIDCSGAGFDVTRNDVGAESVLPIP